MTASEDEADPQDGLAAPRVQVGSPWIDAFVTMLDEVGGAVIPRPVMLSPKDAEALDEARTTAVDLMAELGWTSLIPELRRRVGEWLQGRIQHGQFREMYFGTWSSRPEDRLQALEILDDLALAMLLRDRLEPEDFDRLVGRWEVGSGRTMPRV